MSTPSILEVILIPRSTGGARFPNSDLPLLIYRAAFTSGQVPQLQAQLQANGWSNCWLNGIFSYHHYHSDSHEALAVVKGQATVLFGGDSGTQATVAEGDLVVIPAGVAHKRLHGSPDFQVMGAYPGGAEPDLLTGKTEERPLADQTLARVPVPERDPLQGWTPLGIGQYWHQSSSS